MGWYTPTSRQQFFRSYPKVDLHRHLEGSLRFKTLLDVAHQHGITLPVSPDLSSLVQMQPGDTLNFQPFYPNFSIYACFIARLRSSSG
jgi:adenosine deaminase